MTPGKTKRITVHYLPKTELPREVYETAGKAGYHVHEGESGNPIGYRIYVDNLTYLIPAANVHKIETDL
jgi:hypothetical protein